MNRNHGFSLLLIIPLLAIILATILLLVAPSISIKDNTQQLISNKVQDYDLGETDTYQSDYWGFSIKYPNNYYVREFSKGVIIYNFEVPEGKYFDKAESKDDLYIKIEVDTSPSDSHTNEQDYFREITVDGNTYKVKRESDNSDLWASIPNNNYKYVFRASVGNENLTGTALGILSTMKFHPIMQYENSNIPIPESFERYENNNWGIAFDYPNEASFSGFNILNHSTIEYENNRIQVVMIPRRGEPGSEIDEIKRNLTLGADGPGTGTYSPPERMKFENFMNLHRTNGYKVTRYTEEYKLDNKVAEYVEELYVFPVENQEHLAVAIGPIQNFEFTVDSSELTELIAENFQLLNLQD